MSGKVYDVVAPVGTYTDPNTGQEKTKWHNCGAVIRTGNGNLVLKLDSLPVNPSPNRDAQPGLWLSLFEPQPRQQQGGGGGQPQAQRGQAAPQAAPQGGAPGEDVPW